MPRFFIDNCKEEFCTIEGEDAMHIAKSLRMKKGDRLTLCDRAGMDHLCSIEEILPSCVALRVLESSPCQSEPALKVTLYQGLPKGDKMDWIVQKAVELGVYAVVPMLTARCVSRPDKKSALKKTERWQKIAEEAAKQSGRGIIPKIMPLTEMEQAVLQGTQADASVLFYEGGGQSIGSLSVPGTGSVSVYIGPEGGFENQEVESFLQAGGRVATLGPRILRTETAPIAALSVLMHVSGNL